MEKYTDKEFKKILKRFSSLWWYVAKHYDRLTEKQREICFNEDIKNGLGSSWFEFCSDYLKESKTRTNIALDNAIEKNKAHYILKSYPDFLTGCQIRKAIDNSIVNNHAWFTFTKDYYKHSTEEQRDIAFDSCIKNDDGYFILAFYYFNLTPDQRDIAFENAINFRNSIKNGYASNLLKHCKILNPIQRNICKKQALVELY